LYCLFYICVVLEIRQEGEGHSMTGLNPTHFSLSKTRTWISFYVFIFFFVCNNL